MTAPMLVSKSTAGAILSSWTRGASVGRATKDKSGIGLWTSKNRSHFRACLDESGVLRYRREYMSISILRRTEDGSWELSADEMSIRFSKRPPVAPIDQSKLTSTASGEEEKIEDPGIERATGSARDQNARTRFRTPSSLLIVLQIVSPRMCMICRRSSALPRLATSLKPTPQASH